MSRASRCAAMIAASQVMRSDRPRPRRRRSARRRSSGCRPAATIGSTSIQLSLTPRSSSQVANCLLETAPLERARRRLGASAGVPIARRCEPRSGAPPGPGRRCRAPAAAASSPADARVVHRAQPRHAGRRWRDCSVRAPVRPTACRAPSSSRAAAPAGSFHARGRSSSTPAPDRATAPRAASRRRTTDAGGRDACGPTVRPDPLNERMRENGSRPDTVP